MTRSIILAGALSVLIAASAFADQGVKRVPTTPTSPASGQEMFAAYCASCHGLQGKGNGPAASALKKTPADLTTLAARNAGKFPENHVYATIQGDGSTPAHGSKDMPVWGNVFQNMSHGNPGEVQMRIANLTAYLKTLQVK